MELDRWGHVSGREHVVKDDFEIAFLGLLATVFLKKSIMGIKSQDIFLILTFLKINL